METDTFFSSSDRVALSMALDMAIVEYRARRADCIKFGMFTASAMYYRAIQEWKALNVRLGFPASPPPYLSSRR